MEKQYFTLLHRNGNWWLYQDGEPVFKGEKSDRLTELADAYNVPSHVIRTYIDNPYLLEKSFLEWERGGRG